MQLTHDVRYALRGLRNKPGFAAIAVVTIALAIGANTAIFSFINAALIDPLPYPDAGRIMLVLERRPDGGRNGISTLNYLDWAEQNTVFEYMAAQAGWGVTLTGGEEPERLNGARVSAHFFDINGTVAALGRTFRAGEDEPGNDEVVVLSHAFWQSRYGGDPAIVGRTISLDDVQHTVVGVLPEGNAYDRSFAQLWKPLAFEPENMTRDFHWFRALGKLAPGVTLEQARAEMDVIGARISDAYPDSNKDWGIAVDPLSEMIINAEVRTTILVLFGATLCVLLIGCANLASLALARGIAREREIAVRASLGAGRWRLARQLLTENVLLSVLGGIVGIAIGYAAMHAIDASIPQGTLPAEIDVRMDVSVLTFALVAAVATGLLFGLAPAIQATKPNLAGTMKDGGHGTTVAAPGRRLRATLVVGEVALAFVLLVGAGLLIRSLDRLLELDPGFDSTNVLTAGLPVSQDRYAEPDVLNNYLRTLGDAVEAVPGVSEIAMTSALPLSGWGYGMPMQIADRDIVDRANRTGGFFKMVSPSYFSTLRMRLVSGRFLEATDTAGAPPVALINETFANREFPDDDPIGKRLLVQQIVPGRTQLGDEIPWEIVGVIADEKVNNLSDDESGGMYVPMEQSPVYRTDMVIRADIEPLGLERAVREAIANIDADQPVSNVRTLEDIERASVVPNRIQTTLLGTFAVIAILLAAIGIYGVISNAVAQRAHEMGIRAALGASSRHLQTLVFNSGMRPALIGMAIGLVAALVLTRVMASMLFGVSARDPVTFAVVAITLAMVAAFASFIPARRVVRVEPSAALRSD